MFGIHIFGKKRSNKDEYHTPKGVKGAYKKIGKKIVERGERRKVSRTKRSFLSGF